MMTKIVFVKQEDVLGGINTIMRNASTKRKFVLIIVVSLVQLLFRNVFKTNVLLN